MTNGDPQDYRFVLHPNWHASCKVYAASRVDPSCQLAEGVIIWHGTTILEHCQIGRDCLIADGVSIGRRVQIGEGTRIQHGAAIPDDATIGARVFIASNVSLADVDYPNLVNRELEQHRPPVIEDEAVICCNAVICPGVVIGRGALVGAGSVVTRDVGPGKVVAGNPARQLLKAKRRLVLMNEAGEVAHE